jgi:hypothetical protein
MYNSEMIINFIKKYISFFFFHIYEKNIVLNGQKLSLQNETKKKIKNLSEVEFSVFSQWGEDGIIDWLISQFNYIPERFVEFGVGDYLESNTRFLIKTRNWQGLILESNRSDCAKIILDPIYWRYDLILKNVFITKKNINKLIRNNLTNLEVGLLSIDLDGNDYWIIEAINCIEPYIVVCEYNSIFGDKKMITTPYKSSFSRNSSHYSNLFFGSSIKALIRLMKDKGYAFIGSNLNGVNAFFIRNDYAKNILKKIKKVQCFPSKFRESRNSKGKKNFIRGLGRFRVIKNKKVFDLNQKKLLPLSKIKNIYSSHWKKQIN